MKCNVCLTENATVHLTQIDPGKNVGPMKIHLCMKCATEKGVNDPAGFSLADLLTAVKSSQRADGEHHD